MSLRFIVKKEQIHAIDVKLKARYPSHCCILRLPEALAALMLRIFSLAGQTLATFSAEEVEGKRVHQLKSSLAKQIGVTRFRQKWLAEDHSELHDDAAVPCCDVQLAILDFVEAQEDEIDHLCSACYENQPDKLVDLLRKPLNPNGKHKRPGVMQALLFAAASGNSHIVQLLLEAGTDTEICADVHLEDGDVYFEPGDGRTALHWASENGHSDVVKLLLGAGADKDKADVEQRTALHLAAEKGHSKVVNLLLETGADKDATDQKGQTTLRLAASTGHSEIVRLMLEAGADKDAADNDGVTALHLAASNGHSEVVQLLVEAGAEINVADRHGRLPLDLARHHRDIIKLLQPKPRPQKRQRLKR